MRFGMKTPRSTARHALTAALSLALAACTPAGPTPEPEATLLAAPWTSVAATTEPTVEAPAMGTVTVGTPATPGDAAATIDIAAFATELSATIAAMASPGPTFAPRVAVNTAVPIAGCVVPKRPFDSSVALAGDVPDRIRAWWYADASAPRTFDGEVVEHARGAGVTHLRAIRDGDAFEATITTDGSLGLEPGHRVHVAWQHVGTGTAGLESLGFALLVSDDAGLVAHVLSRKADLPADEPLLGGDRAGWTIEQLRSPCMTPERVCGVALYAAPVRFALGDATLVVDPGAGDVLQTVDGTHAFDISVATSHVAVAEGAITCPDGVSWPLSYRIVRR